MPMLPNAVAAYIEPDKISGYLLDANHNVGGPKAKFFNRFGFSADKPEVLEAALLEHMRQYDAVARPLTSHGQKFEIIGPLVCPDGRLPTVKAVWTIDLGASAPRLVTAYPA